MPTMLLDTIFAPFVKERPICVMARASLERLLDAQRLDALFARTAERQYTRELLFSSLVQLMCEVVLGVHPTVHAAYQANKDAIGVSTTALYNKLDRVETGVAAALVRDSAALAEPVVKALRGNHPRWLPGYQIKVLDGNHLASRAGAPHSWSVSTASSKVSFSAVPRARAPPAVARYTNNRCSCAILTAVRPCGSVALRSSSRSRPETGTLSSISSPMSRAPGRLPRSCHGYT